ncbi:phosphoribosyltransferase-like protein [Botrimarina hoheduenensis]|uniref:PRTase-CE domain-containing protein n=1 Tax=Botrimarina hoheduenensis TaxID=2528000 RepID=A0A5C5VV23_9BACT|nr:hypothetical protein Pla111_30860 [Botrimarina hoheduenensis]
MLAHSVNRAFVREKSSFFTESHVWPLQTRLDPDGWLRNFQPDEEELAVHLLNGFCYFSDRLVDELFAASFLRLSRHVVLPGTPAVAAKAAWAKFFDELVVTYPTGETPSDADSGHLFVRRARDLLGIPEERIMSPERALEIATTASVSAIVFVDDFVGSGNQFLTTIQRKYGTASQSFADLASSLPTCFYIPLFCTSLAVNNALTFLPKNISCVPLHVLGDEYSALNAPSVFWPAALASDGPAFVKRVSERLCLDDTNGASTTDWQGFARLGLGIAFEHQIPDACLPIFYTTQSGWRPLWRRD